MAYSCFMREKNANQDLLAEVDAKIAKWNGKLHIFSFSAFWALFLLGMCKASACKNCPYATTLQITITILLNGAHVQSTIADSDRFLTRRGLFFLNTKRSTQSSKHRTGIVKANLHQCVDKMRSHEKFSCWSQNWKQKCNEEILHGLKRSEGTVSSWDLHAFYSLTSVASVNWNNIK